MVPGLSYAKALRCIGQDLELRGLKTFDLSTDGSKYIVECGYQTPPAPTPVILHYTAEDIEQLDRAGAEKRGQSAVSREFLTLSQIFRTIGGFLDKNDSLLRRLSNNHASERGFRIEYGTSDGEQVIDDRPGSAIYDMCVSMYKQRGKLTGAARGVGRRDW